MRCDDVRPLISLGLDGELDEVRDAQMRAHLAGCAQCDAEREALSVTVRLLRALPEADPPAALRRRIGAALLDAQRRPEGRWLGLLGLVRPPRPAWAWGAAAIAIAVVGLLASRAPSPTRTAARVPAPAMAPAFTESRAQRPTVGTLTAAKPDLPVPSPVKSAAALQQAPPVSGAAAAPGAPSKAPARVGPEAETPARTPIASLPPRRMLTAVRQSVSPPPVVVRAASSAPPHRSPPSGRLESSSHEAPTPVRTEPMPAGTLPDVPDEATWPDTSGMTQMASGDPGSGAPATSSDDLDELRSRLTHRPLQVPQLGELKPANAPRSAREGWIRF